MPSAEQRDQLKELLIVPAGARRSALDRLRRGPTQPTTTGLVEALRRLNDVRELGVSELDRSSIPAGRLRVLARYASTARAQVFQRMPAERGIATLLACCRPPPRTTCWTSWTCCSPICWHVRKVKRSGVDYAPSVIWTWLPYCCATSGCSYSTSPRPIRRCAARSSGRPRERIEHAVETIRELARPPENQQRPKPCSAATARSASLCRRSWRPSLRTRLTVAERCWQPGSSCAASSGWRHHRCTRLRCASSRRPGDGWSSARTRASTAGRIPSVCCRRRSPRSNGATCGFRQASTGEIHERSCSAATPGKRNAHQSAAYWGETSGQNPS
jgi:hypothetical protein